MLSYTTTTSVKKEKLMVELPEALPGPACPLRSPRSRFRNCKPRGIVRRAEVGEKGEDDDRTVAVSGDCVCLFQLHWKRTDGIILR